MAVGAAVCVLASPAGELATEEVAIVTDINLGGAGSYPSYLLVFGNHLYFRANNISGGTNTELWRYDGATAELVADISPGPTGSDPSYLTMYRGDLYFSARGCDSCGMKLWRYDGAEVALAPGGESGAGNPQDLFVYADQLLFRAFRSGIGIELWKFDGSSQTPIDIFPGSGSSYPQHFIEFQGDLYFNAGVMNDGGELWRYDGSAPQLALNITPGYGSSPESFVVFDGDLYFSANDGSSGRELWRYNGITGELVADINDGPGSSNPSGMTVYREAIYFCAEDDHDGSEGYELWRYDGMRAELVANINGNLPVPHIDPVHHSFPGNLIVFNDILYFTADDGIHGRELWKYDGETASLVADIWPGPTGSNLGEFVIYRDQLYFLADDGESGGELGTSLPALWRLTISTTPGVPSSPRLIKIIENGATIPGTSVVLSHVGVPSADAEGTIVFCGNSQSGGTGLYRMKDGALQVVADASTPIPGQYGNTFAHGFRSYGAAVDEGIVSFYAYTVSTELGGGVYVWRDGAVSLVADMSTPIPGGAGTFNAIEDAFGFGPFSHPPIDGGHIAFRAASESPRQRGVYTSIGSVLDVAANLETPIPEGEGNFVFLSAEISIERGSVAFRGEGVNFQRGIYTNLTGELTKVADLGDPVPGGTGNFTSVEYPWIDGGRVLFTGEGANGQQGIYIFQDGINSLVVDRNTPIPEGTGTFTDFLFNASQPSISGEYVAFRGLGIGGQQGLYLAAPDSVRKIVDRWDGIDGKIIRSLGMGPQSLVGTTLYFQVCFTDGTCAIYASADVFRRGDVNGDGSMDIGDPITLLFYILGDAARPPCRKAADADDTGAIDITDAIYLLSYLFLSGPFPQEPFDECGIDPTIDALSCESSEACEKS